MRCDNQFLGVTLQPTDRPWELPENKLRQDDMIKSMSILPGVGIVNGL
jgi:hypothetical protein